MNCYHYYCKYIENIDPRPIDYTIVLTIFIDIMSVILFTRNATENIKS